MSKTTSGTYHYPVNTGHDGATREDVVKTEIEDNDNDNLTIPQVINRLGMVFFLLIFNLGITIFVFLLTGMMIFGSSVVSVGEIPA